MSKEFTMREFSIYRLDEQLPDRVQAILEQMREKFSGEMGVTLVGNRVTVRFQDADTGHRAEVHMVLLDVSLTGEGDVPYLDPNEEMWQDCVIEKE